VKIVNLHCFYKIPISLNQLKKMKLKLAFAGTVVFLCLAISAWKTADDPKPKNVNWGEYLGGKDRNHYSELTQINAGNVSRLKVAWTYSMADSGQMQTNPLVIDGILYGISPKVQLFALDASTGKELWTFQEKLSNWASTSRGVAYWESGEDKRILYTVGSFLYAINAKTGKQIESFGQNGKVDLHVGLPEIAKDKFIISNTPGTIFEDLIVMPLRLSEGSDAAPGDIRAFNVRTGKLAWTFHTIPYPGEYGYETFPKNTYKNENVGAANNWSGMAVDVKKGILYVPTGSAAFDFYGGNRTGKNLFANCLLALNARTGKRLWHYQTMHHDIWDRDLPAPPNLVTIKSNGKMVDAVAQVTKQGYVFVFDRVTGKPLFPIKELVAPKSAIPGEITWPTQPIPTKPLPYARQAYQLSDNDISPYAENRAELLENFKTYDKKQFAPPSRNGTVIFPGLDGGAEWGGAAADPEGILYVNSNEMAWILKIIDAPKPDQLSALPLGERTYKVSCSQCHGADLKGNPKSNYPSLINIGQKLDRETLTARINNGKGMMPGFSALKPAEKLALTDFLLGLEKKEVGAEALKKSYYLPYTTTGYNKFLDNKGHPAITPPWGTLNAINLNTGEYLWKIPFGNEPNLEVKGTGTENYGGPVITASGLLFIAATKDGQFRVFNKKNGELLWETTLPFAAFATPATYMVNGKQYVVLACGGTKLGTKAGNQYVAYALP
jgi:quinoprotein glucose dehydrogenase